MEELDDTIASMERRIKKMETYLGIDEEDYEVETVPIIQRIEEFENKLEKMNKPEIQALHHQIQTINKLLVTDFRTNTLSSRLQYVVNSQEILEQFNEQLTELMKYDANDIDEKMMAKLNEGKQKVKASSDMLGEYIGNVGCIESGCEALIKCYYNLVNGINNKIARICDAVSQMSGSREEKQAGMNVLSALLNK